MTTLTKSESDLEKRKMIAQKKKSIRDKKKFEEEQRRIEEEYLLQGECKISAEKLYVEEKDKLNEFDIVLNGETIVKIVFSETLRTLEKIYRDFNEITIEGIKFTFNNKKCSFVMNTKSLLIFN